MRITVPKDAKSGNVMIPRGDYWVSLHPEMQMIFLSGAGRDYKIMATKRRSKSKYKTITVTFFSAGGAFWSLLVATPKYGEWIALIELGTSSREDDRRRR
jgi:hypothetical protein